MNKKRKTKTKKKVKKRSDYFDRIPEDIIFNVFLKLSTKSLCKLRCVSKRWLSIISDPDFIEAHTACASPKLLISYPYGRTEYKFFSFKYPDVEQPILVLSAIRVLHNRSLCFSQSLGGLVCIYAQGCCHKWTPIIRYRIAPQIVTIFNPSTQERVDLRQPFHIEDPREFGLTYMNMVLFGYDPVEKNHKLLSSWIDMSTGQIHNIHVFTLDGKNPWRRINRHDHPQCSHKGASESICIKGVIYYLAGGWPRGRNSLVSFDVRYETFRAIPVFLHHHSRISYYGHFRLMISNGGRVALLDTLPLIRCFGKTDMWVLEEDLTWSCRPLTIFPSPTLNFYGVYGTARVIMRFYIHYTEDGVLQRHDIRGLSDDHFNFKIVTACDNHIESLVSLKHLRKFEQV